MSYNIKKSKNGVTVEFYDVDSTMYRIAENPKVGRFTAETWARYFSKYAPKQEGILMSNYTTVPWLVTYESPYAHYQWEGVNIYNGEPLNYSKEQNPLATSHWEEAAYDAFKEVVARDIANYIRTR